MYTVVEYLKMMETADRAPGTIRSYRLIFESYARFIGVNPEDALEKTNRKFIQRFQYIEDEAMKLHKPLQEMTLTEMDKFWIEAKKLERKTK